MTNKKEKEPYWGSIRFFKNLILLIILIAIVIPSTVSVIELRRQKALLAAIDQLETQRAELEAALEATATSSTQQTAPLLNQDASALTENAFPTGYTADLPSYSALYPDFYAETLPNGTSRNERVIYLTFDDGPSARTPEILDILRQEEVKATFFVVGNDTEQGKKWMQDIVADGHTLGMHTYSHDYKKIYHSVEDYLADMYQIFCLIKGTTGQTPALFRFAGGSINAYNSDIYQELIAEMLRRGFLYCDWNISGYDATGVSISAQEISDVVISQAASRSRGVVLMHDTYKNTALVEALPSMIQQLCERGFVFDKLTQRSELVLFEYPS